MGMWCRPPGCLDPGGGEMDRFCQITSITFIICNGLRAYKNILEIQNYLCKK